ncbi:MAG: biotin/lipoyl-binding protein [Spirochaetaceae bacterium]|nr:MAG: biotin/lipoyl-binding protein [Spirochaetaceae bacterium]
MKKKIDLMVTAFRDGFQSVFGARVATADFLPAVEATVAAGLTHLEVGGGARFQSLYFYCNEDAFDMMDAVRAATGPQANLQTLARGVNVVGLDSQPRDMIKLHAELFKKHGITTIRNFDALNDVNNLIYSGQCIHDAGLKHEVAVTLMALPPGIEGAHTPEFYTQTLRDILDAGIPFDSVVYKDASGTATPSTVRESIRQARELLGADARIVFHTHETAGVSIPCYLAAIEAGANQVDCALAPVSGGTSQPDVISLWHALRGSEYELGIDVAKVREAEEIFKECMSEYFVPPEARSVEPLIPFSPMPGGALTANTQMMRDNNILDHYAEVAAAMEEVISRGGYATSVTPVSQFYFQQAFNNVMAGPWKKIAEGYGKMVLGYFGKTPTDPDPEIIQLASQQLKLEPTSENPVDLNDKDPTKGRGAAVKALEAEGLPITDENVFIAATCKEKGIAFLKGEARQMIRKKKPRQAEKGSQSYVVTIDGSPYTVEIGEDATIVNGRTYSVEVQPADAAEAGSRAGDRTPSSQPGKAAAGKGGSTEVKAPLPGTVLRISAKAGDKVSEGDALLVLESMKMETAVAAPSDGTVDEISVAVGDQVSADQKLAVIRS